MSYWCIESTDPYTCNLFGLTPNAFFGYYALSSILLYVQLSPKCISDLLILASVSTFLKVFVYFVLPFPLIDIFWCSLFYSIEIIWNCSFIMVKITTCTYLWAGRLHGNGWAPGIWLACAFPRIVLILTVCQLLPLIAWWRSKGPKRRK